MKTKSPQAGERTQLTIRRNIPRLISPSADGTELFCERRVEFSELPADANVREDDNDGIRIYGSHSCAVLQLRGVCALTPGGKARRLIATASHLDRKEVRALITKLTEIEATLD